MNSRNVATVNPSIVNWPASEYRRVATIALAVYATTAATAIAIHKSMLVVFLGNNVAGTAFLNRPSLLSRKIAGKLVCESHLQATSRCWPTRLRRLCDFVPLFSKSSRRADSCRSKSVGERYTSAGAIKGQSVGTLSQDFVDRLVCDVSTFLLSGRPWAVAQINHNDRRVVVVPSPIGRQPTWGGYLPQFLGRELCQQILRVTTSTDSYPYLEPESLAVLNEQRQALGRFLHPTRGGLDGDAVELRWWTFAGGRINLTLRYAIAALEPDWTVMPDNYALKIRRIGDSGEWLASTTERLMQDDLWTDETLWTTIHASLPNYRLTKFQPLMPDWVERETLVNHLLDVPGTKQWLASQAVG